MPIDPDLDPILEELRTAITDVKGQVQTLSSDVTRWTNEFDATVGQLGERVARLEAGTGTTTPPPPPPPTDDEWEPAFPGDHRAGFIRWGSSVGGNADPTERHEKPAGVALGVRRTFWSLDQATKLIATCKTDHNAGRLPWVSIKLPATWESTANGALDTKLVSLFKSLDALDLPIWFTAHHEPEGGGSTPAGQTDDPGGAVAWRNMQKRMRALLTQVGTKNIALVPILMAWTFDARSNRNPADWWVDGIWDFAGIDVYQETAGKGGPQATTGWKNASAFYKAKNMRIAVGEWGNRGTDAVAAAEMQNFYDHLRGINSPGASYFDSGLNSPSGSWELVGEPLTKYHQLLNGPYSLLVSEV